MLVYAENDYGKTKLVTADFTTDEMPYEGTLVIGNYKMPVRHTAGFEPRTKTLDINRHTGMTGLHTLKVETGVCEPLPHKGFSRHSVSPVAVAR